MKQTPKEKLNNKARKMIDLIYDEVVEGGEKEITASFFDSKTSTRLNLTVKVQVSRGTECPEIPTSFDDVVPNDSG